MMYSHRKYTVRKQRTHLPIREEGSGGEGATDMLTLRLTFGTMRKKYCSILLHTNRKGKKAFLQTTAQKSTLILIY